MDGTTRVAEAIQEHVAIAQTLLAMADEIAELGGLMAERLKDGGKILWMGNGGSAADCQHLAAELVGRFRKEREAMASIALTTDTSILTAVGNDYGYDEVFRRQVLALCAPGDVVIGLSTSGNSPNVLRGLEAARAKGGILVGFTGESGGKMKDICDISLRVPSSNTARIQEMHITVGHILCEIIEAAA